MRLTLLSILSLGMLLSCSRNAAPVSVGPEDFHASVDQVMEIMIHDIFSPPVASRIFAYPNIAAYEIVALHNPEYVSLVGQVNGLTPIPRPDAAADIDYQLAALVAHMELSKRLIFSEDRMTSFRDSLYARWERVDKARIQASRDYGMKVAEHIGLWMDQDNYKETRTMPKFTIRTEDPSRWQPTPPAYMDGLEPHWNKIRTLVLDSASQFKPIPPPAFSLKEDSPFYRELMEVHDVGKRITGIGDTAEEVQIAKFWDCNPYVSVTRGHLMFATKKITPGAHWIGIVKIACRKARLGFDDTVYAYTKTSMGIFEGFISCWDEKYRSNLIRPETLINQYIDENWKPILQTPPFPEYSSGHSVVSGAAAVVLTDVFGDNFSFADDTELPFGLPVRTFSSFNQASAEAAISRMYGGIHYRAAVEQGLTQGRTIGNFLVGELNMRKGGNNLAIR